MKCTARNIRILTSEEMLTILRKSATLYSEYVDTTLLFIFRKSKSDSYDYYEVRFGKNNFMHLAGIKSESLNANEFYEACISGEITREQCKPRRDASTMYSKIGVMEKILDLRNSKCYKIGEKDLVTRDNDFEMATGNSTGVIGYDSRIKKKGTNQVDRTKAPVPTTLLNSAITNYCSDPQKIMFILQKTYVEKILFNTQRLSGLVGNILLLSKLENQNIPMKKTEYRLDEQIRQAFLSLETKWTEKEIGFQVELEEVKYTGNEGLFMHIWMNLLDNAIKFSPAKGTIMMFLKQEKDSVMFILEDEGPGIEDDVKTRIFDKFYQADGSHKAEGNGLGLALVKRIVDSAGGTIKAETREYGGCRFVVELPIQKDEAI